jgi:alkanesulfonate monooxygenase SsuD/methylene tetrahydromethanopterin reductase-like flavin-dependent oxidoreductase (luciferase family)
LNAWQQGLEQLEVADRVGIDYLWEVEHHFLEEYSHSSASESFLAAASQRTKRIRLGSGVTLLPPPINHPARVAERVGALDLLSRGRAEFGTGESSSFSELDAFHVSRTEKRAMWHEALGVICRMMVEEPFQGHEGKYIQFPPRNIIPKPIQKPHPPLWVACSRQETIVMAASMGIGALTFGFLSPTDAKKWTHDYYSTLEVCHPIGYAVNPNVGFLSGFMCHRDSARARQLGGENSPFFGYCFRHYYVDGFHRPGETNIWNAFKNTPTPELMRLIGADSAGPSCIGSPDEIRKVLLDYEAAGVDQVIFIAQAGKLQHEDICESLELFGKTIVPEFKERDEKYVREKAKRLEPVVEAAMKRRVEPKSPESYKDYAYHAGGENIRHFAYDPAKEKKRA